MLIQEPEIAPDNVLIIKDRYFNKENVCIVTGAGSGIGRATAIAAAKNGLITIGMDIDEDKGQETQNMVKESGGQMIYLKTDLCDDTAVKRSVETASALGQIRYLANIAGIQHINAIEDFPMEKYDSMLNLMLRAPFLLSKLVIPYMKKNPENMGVIANMSSIHGHICTMNKSVYNITKFGLRALSQSISAEGNGNIRSFTVSTGYVKTRLALEQIAAQAEQRGIREDEVIKTVMLGKSQVKEMMTPLEVANLFIFGFSHHSRYLAGGDLLFDGGAVRTY